MCEYPSKYECRFTLKNKEDILIRPLKAADRPLLQGLFDRLSERSRYFRFLMNMRFFPKHMLDQLVDMDYDAKFALAGVVKENGGDAVVAVARYAYSQADGFAELAITVRDDFQNLGLGTHMLKLITDIGSEHGYHRFTGIIEPGNKAILHLAAAYDPNFVIKDNAYYVEFTV